MTSSGPGSAPKATTRRVIAGTLNYGIGSFLPQVLSLLLLPLYARLLTPADYGVVEVYTTVGALLTIVMRGGLTGSVARLYYDRSDERDVADLVTTVAVAVTGLATGIAALALVSGPWVLRKMAPEVPVGWYLGITVLTAALQAPVDIQRRILQVYEQSSYSARLSVGLGLAGVALNVLFVLALRLKAEGVLLAALLTVALNFLIAVWNQRRFLRGRWRHDLFRGAVAYGFPLVPHHTAAWAHQFANRWVLAKFGSLATVGLLGMAAKVTSPLLLASGAFATAYNPVYFSVRSSGASDARDEIGRVARLVMVGGLIAVAAASTLGAATVRVLTPPSYHGAAPLLGIMAAALFLHLVYTVVGAEVSYAKRTRGIAAVFALSASANLAVVAALGGSLGAVAGALGQLVGGVVSVVVIGRIAKATFPLPYTRRDALFVLGVLVVCGILPIALAPTNRAVDIALNASLFVVVTLGAVTLGTGRSVRAFLNDLRRFLGAGMRGA